MTEGRTNIRQAIAEAVTDSRCSTVTIRCNPNLMGNLVNHRITNWAAYVVATLIIGLNIFLIYSTFAP